MLRKPVREEAGATSGGVAPSPDRPLPDYPFTSRWFDNEGIGQHYLDEGKGSPVLMLHGNPSWSYHWRHLVTALRDDHRCVVPDHIGMGWSDRPAESAYPYSAARRVADLDRLVEHLVEARGAPRHGWTLVAHDWGGPIGLAWARRHPGLVTRVVALNTVAFLWPPGYRLPWFLRLIRDVPPAARFVDRTNAFALAAVRLGTTRGLGRAAREAYVAPYAHRRHRRAVVRFVQDIPLSPADPAWELFGPDEDPTAGLPLFIGWGARDPVFDDRILQEWLRRFPGAEVHLYPKAGHYVLEDAGEELIPAILRFVRSSDHGSHRSPRPGGK
ncbi:alpha/beta fold hydrolase [Saccharothrix sp. Mg75]|uniref:alpha/beta fold hydrolase n=1 Tax=Saccharothrix sp. Mg75 TaxID=3445357 RepID=UPI003EE88438